MNQTNKSTIQLVLERETKNCLVFCEVPASEPVLRSPLYLPKPASGEQPVALNVTIEVAATQPAPTPIAEMPAPQKPGRRKRARTAVAA